MAERVYLDWNATAPLRPEAKAALDEALALTGNASSVHAEGRAVRAIVEAARAKVAALAGAKAKDVTFTASATEANMLALTPAVFSGAGNEPRDRLFVSAIEHPSVHGGGRFAADKVEHLPVTADGLLDMGQLRLRLARAQRPLVSVMLANNETGAIQPIADVAAIVHEAGGLLHVDAVQAPGRIDCRIDDLGADLLTLSSHKLGGAQGAGAVVRRDGVYLAEPLIKGGGQERGLRGGTENVAAIAAFGAAVSVAQAAMAADTARMATLRERLERGLLAATPGLMIFSRDVPRLPNTTLFAVPGLKAETLIIAFDLNGIAVSSGSACSSGKVAASHVLAAMGVAPALSSGAVRVSLGWNTRESDVERFLGTWIMLSTSLLKGRPGIAA